MSKLRSIAKLRAFYGIVSLLINGDSQATAIRLIIFLVSKLFFFRRIALMMESLSEFRLLF